MSSKNQSNQPGSQQDSERGKPPHSQINPDDPVPSYETALREGAGTAGPSSASFSSAPPPPTDTVLASTPNYGTPPYPSSEAGRILILPAPAPHPHRSGPLLPPPTSADSPPRGPRAGRRFCAALLYAFLVYCLLGLVTGAITGAAINEGQRRHDHDHDHERAGKPHDRAPGGTPWDHRDGRWIGVW